MRLHHLRYRAAHASILSTVARGKQTKATSLAPPACTGRRAQAAAVATVALVGLATATLLGRALLAERQTVDDVFIFLRYARNLAEHGAYAFNVRTGPPVEGTSSPAWTLLLAAAWGAGLHGIGPAKGLSLGAAALIPIAAAFAVRRAVPGRPLLAAVPAMALALDADLATWAASGMDTALWSLACVACVGLAACRRPRAAALAAGALAMVRPEGPLFAVAVVAALGRDRRSLLRLALRARRNRRCESRSVIVIAMFSAAPSSGTNPSACRSSGM